jgi:hypothetical protein
MYQSSEGTDAGVLAIGARFSAGAALGLGRDADGVLAAHGQGWREQFFPIPLPPGVLTGTSVGSYIDIPMQWGPRGGYYWDVLGITVTGFTAGVVAVTLNGPAVTAAGAPVAVEWGAQLGPPPAGQIAVVQTFTKAAPPFLDPSMRLVFTVVSALTLASGYGGVQITGGIVVVPRNRLDAYIQ